METLYPIFYGTRLVTFDVIEATFKPRMHPEAWRRFANFFLHQGGKFGPGGGYRATQPVKPGFAEPGKSFHQLQHFPSGDFYSALDVVVVNPGYVHRAPRWEEVPKQGTYLAEQYGLHANVDPPPEPWHMQGIEVDGWQRWVNMGRPDLVYNRPILITAPRPQPPQPPVPSNPVQTKEITVQVQSRNLVEGCVGPDVKFFQRQMNDLAGQGLLLDGHYGPRTTEAVTNWQKFFKKTSDGRPLTVDGKLGPHTQQSIFEISLRAS